MKEAIENAFPNVVSGGCLEIETACSFEIFDSATDPKRCFIRREENDPIHFLVSNPNKLDVHFLAIDKCIFNDKEATRCDCSVFVDGSFMFLEISESKKLHRNQKRKAALIQLTNTIDMFRGRGVQFPNHLIAMICFVGKNIYPARNSSNNEARLSFFENHGALLLEGNQYEF